MRDEQGLAHGLLALLERVAGARALDRLIKGRIWIGLIAFSLIGIVALQLLVLALNASIGRTLVHEAALQRQNAALSIEDSELAAGERVESKAQALGMQLVPIGSLRFLASDPRADVARAAQALSTPVRRTTDSGEGVAVGAAQGAPASAAPGAATGEQSAGTATGAPAVQGTTSPAGEAGTSAPGASAGAEQAAAQGTAGTSASSANAPTSSTTPAPASTGEAPATAATAPVGAGGGVGADQADGSG